MVGNFVSYAMNVYRIKLKMLSEERMSMIIDIILHPWSERAVRQRGRDVCQVCLPEDWGGRKQGAAAAVEG